MPRPEFIPEEEDDEFDLQEDWKEVVAQVKPGAGSFSVGSSEDSITVELPARKLRSFIRQVRGYSIADRASPWRLGRPEVPMQHPKYSWMWASGVSIQLWNPLATDVAEVSEDPDAEHEPEYKARLDAYSTYNSPPYEVRYTMAHCTVKFATFKGRLYSDDDPAWTSTTPEYKRFVSMLQANPKAEIVSAVGGNEGTALYWADSSLALTSPQMIAAGPLAGGPGATPTAGREITGSIYTYKPSCLFQVCWDQVEVSYLVDDSDDDYFVLPVPKRLIAHLGTVNKSKIFGQPRGTILLSGMSLVLKSQPLPTDTEWGLDAFDVVFHLDHFDPKRPENANVIIVPGPAPISTDPLRGHHCFPFAQNGFFYPATRGSPTTAGTYSGQTLIRETEFADMFRHVKDPTPLP